MARFRARAPRTGTVDVKRLICSKDQQAEILTKALPKECFERLRNDIGVVCAF